MGTTDSSSNMETSKRPSNSLLKQQKLPAWQPVLTPKIVIVGFLVVGFLFIPLGILFLTSANAVKQVEVDYTDCDPSSVPSGVQNCSVSLSVPAMEGPVYVYYQLTNYYQNQRRYVKSRNDDASKGNPNEWYLPCGLVAWSHFNDTLALAPAGGAPVPWVKKGIAWETDVKEKFKNPAPTAPGLRDPLVDFTDEDFIVWMRTAGLPSFRKLYRVIPGGLPAGTYTFSIQSRFYVKPFGGTKGIVISTASWMGGKNTFLGTAYIVVGLLCVLIGAAFLIAQVLFPRKLSDNAYLIDNDLQSSS